MTIALTEVDANDDVAEILVQTLTLRSGAIKLGNCAAANHFSMDVEFVPQLLLPLVA